MSSQREAPPITKEASLNFGIVICGLTILDAERCRLRSFRGLEDEQIRRDVAMCSYTILSDEVMVARSRGGPALRGQAASTGLPRLWFYAGAPIIWAPGTRFGTLCLLDMAPRAFGRGDQAELQVFTDEARSALIELELDRR